MSYEPNPVSHENEPTESATKPRRWPWIAGIVTALALAGCSGPTAEPVAGRTQPETVDADVSSVPVETAEPEPKPKPELPQVELSSRGNIVKEIGEVAGALQVGSTTMDDAWLQFTVDGIETDAECTSDYFEPALNGHFVVITITASTSSDWPVDLDGVTVDFNEYDWSVVGPDGVTENDVTGTAYSCLDEPDRIAQIGPGENVTGKLALDVAAETGVLVYRPWYMGGGSGWEWEF